MGIKRTFDDEGAVQEWQPPPGESPAEREKRIKKEKWLQNLAARGIQPEVPRQDSHPKPREPLPALSTEFVPLGESPEEREKRIKREKRQQWLAQKENSNGHDANASASNVRGRSWTSTNAAGPSEPQPEPEPPMPKPPKEKTRAKVRYLRRKKLRRKARTQSQKKKPQTKAVPKEDSEEDSDDGSSDSEAASDHKERGKKEIEKSPKDNTGSDSDSESESDSSESDSSGSETSSSSDSSSRSSVSSSSQSSNASPPSKENQESVVFSLPAPRRPDGPQTELLESMKIDENLRNVESVDASVTMPLAEISISSHTASQLAKMDVSNWFAVQTKVVPLLQKSSTLMPSQTPRDVCVCAPTGSGKTLSYAVPIVDSLLGRIRIATRALVILPTRELAIQVRDTFHSLVSGTNLRVATLMGQHSFASEQQSLVSSAGDAYIPQADIVIATPGRLLDHLSVTRGFNLEHVDFLVIDEADHLFKQSYYGWINKIMTSLGENGLSPSIAPEACQVSQIQKTQKLLFSATLTRDPAMTSLLRLHKPIYIAVESSDAASNVPQVPESLEEMYSVVPQEYKPLFFLYLIENYARSGTLCFANTIESATLLASLLKIYQEERKKVDAAYTPIVIEHFSSTLSTKDRAALISNFSRGTVQVVIATDVMARGLDLDSVAHVLNYDMPTTLTTYIHRVGRTARAGRHGDAITLCNKSEAKPFLIMMHERSEKLSRIRIKTHKVEHFIPTLETSLAKLKGS